MWSDNEKTPPSPQDATAAWLAAFSREGVPVGTPSPPLPRAPIALYDELDASDAKRSTGAAGDPLGIYTKNPSLFSPEKRPSLIGKVLARRGDIELPDKKDQAANRLERWALQSVARHALPDSRTAACMRNRAKGCPDVAVKWSKAAERASYANLQVCGSVWACPVCAAKISEHRRKELLDLVEKHQAAGGFVYLITRTFSHKSTASLAALQGGLKVAEGKLKSGKYWQSMKADFGYVGTVRALEVTLASASGGWHPHIHELWFVASKLTTQQQEELRARMFDKWAKACAAAGLGAPSEEHGVDVRGGKDAARYISKWGMASELTKGHVKNSAKGLSPFDLLRVGLHTKDTGAAAGPRPVRGICRSHEGAAAARMVQRPAEKIRHRGQGRCRGGRRHRTRCGGAGPHGHGPMARHRADRAPGPTAGSHQRSGRPMVGSGGRHRPGGGTTPKGCRGGTP